MIAPSPPRFAAGLPAGFAAFARADAPLPFADSVPSVAGAVFFAEAACLGVGAGAPRVAAFFAGAERGAVVACFATGLPAAAFRGAAFRGAAFFDATLLGATFLAVAFFIAALLGAAFRGAAFLAPAFFAAAFLGAAFLGAAFFAAAFFAAAFFAAAFFAVVFFAAVFFAAVFFDAVVFAPVARVVRLVAMLGRLQWNGAGRGAANAAVDNRGDIQIG